MDHDMLTLGWVMSGALIGGVVTPLVVENRKFNGWGAMLLGLVVGLVGNIVLLLPLWLILSWQKKRADTRPRWQRDAISLEEALRRAEASVSPAMAFSENLWPAPRAESEHSHRRSYVVVFAALVIITAVEVTLTTIEPGFSIVGPLVALSTTKVLLVAMYFMHLRFDSVWYTSIFAFALPFAGIVLVVLAVA
jgi:cytochrome c oxidase subunit 4